MPDRPARCGQMSLRFHLTCDREEGHVTSQHPDDWHEAASTLSTRQANSAWTHDITQHETVRWAPERYELPAPERYDPQGEN